MVHVDAAARTRAARIIPSGRAAREAATGLCALGYGRVESWRSDAEPETRVNLAAVPVATFPDCDHPDLLAAFKDPAEDLESFAERPVNGDAFVEALMDHPAPLLAAPLLQVA
jgi:hypothetical protein